VLIVVFLVLASPSSSLEGRARLVGPVYLWRNTERRKKERSHLLLLYLAYAAL
jgi:hypothetical protein